MNQAQIRQEIAEIVAGNLRYADPFDRMNLEKGQASWSQGLHYSIRRRSSCRHHYRLAKPRKRSYDRGINAIRTTLNERKKLWD